MHDVACVGGGLIGAAAALGCAQRGCDVVLVDRARPLVQRGDLGIDVRNVAVSPASQAVLQNVGVWADLEAAAYHRMVVWEERGTRQMNFAAQEVGRTELGWILESSPTVEALWQRLETTAGVTLRTGAAVAALSDGPDHVTLHLDDGSEVNARLIIGADGAQSRVREALHVPVQRFPTGHHALATVVRTATPHQGVAYQRFLLSGPLALLPSVRPDLSSVVWSQSPEQAERRRSMDEAEFRAELTRALEGCLGEVTAVDQRIVFPLTQMLVDSFHPVQRVLLIGDAARVMHPLAGLGANVGFEDVRDLLAVLGERGPADPGAPGMWRSFARQRRARAALMVRLMSAFRVAYSSSDPLLQWARNAGVGWLNRAQPLKRQIIKEALGLGPLAGRW